MKIEGHYNDKVVKLANCPVIPPKGHTIRIECDEGMIGFVVKDSYSVFKRNDEYQLCVLEKIVLILDEIEEKNYE